MTARSLLICLVALSSCGPALATRRLAAPKAALAAGKIELKVTNQGSDNVAGTDERVSDALIKSATEHLELAGYTVCTPSPCGDAVLELNLSEASFVLQPEEVTPQQAAFRAQMSAAMIASGFGSGGGVWVSEKSVVKAKLELAAQLTLPNGKSTFKRTATRALDEHGKGPATVMKETLETISKELFEPLRRNTPLGVVTLEGGGPLDHGVALIHAQRLSEATTYFTELTRTRPELDGAFYDLGFVLEAQNNWEPALAAYREAAQKAPGKAHYAAAVTAAENALHGAD